MFLSRRMWRQFIPIALAVTLLCALMYLNFQQVYRTNLNDPQIQISKDVKNALNSGVDPKNIITPGNQINVADSLATFIIIYGQDKKPVAASGHINDKIPSLPDGVFSNVDKNKEVRITWEPKDQVRIAAVVNKTNKNYVLVGRSMKEVENRIAIMGLQILIAWGAILLLVYGSVLLVNQKRKPEKE